MTNQENYAYGLRVACRAALDGFQNRFEVPHSAREFVKRSAATAKDRSGDLHTGANKPRTRSRRLSSAR